MKESGKKYSLDASTSKSIKKMLKTVDSKKNICNFKTKKDVEKEEK
jgi:hypothetical protein